MHLWNELSKLPQWFQPFHIMLQITHFANSISKFSFKSNWMRNIMGSSLTIPRFHQFGWCTFLRRIKLIEWLFMIGCLIALHLYILSFYARHRSLLFLKKDIPTPIREVKVIFPQNEKCFDHIKCILINCEHTSSVLSYFWHQHFLHASRDICMAKRDWVA